MTNAPSTTLEHTPGPWEISRDAVPDWHVQNTIYAANGERVATVFLTEGNAYLVKAAPVLLAALEAILNTTDYATIQAKAEAAIREVRDAQ